MISPDNLPLYCTEDPMKAPTGSPIIMLTSRAISPVIILIGLYVFFHGHYSPGGGFQGGVLMAAGILLLRLTLGIRVSQALMPSALTTKLSAAGALIFGGTALAALLGGGNFLDYKFLPVAWFEPAYLRYYGILFIELGVTMTVMTTLISIYDDLLGC
jgi:multicomponent Na+:H+ antiporter subunit B